MERGMQLSLDFQSLTSACDGPVDARVNISACDWKLARSALPSSNVVLFSHSRLLSQQSRPAVNFDPQADLISRILKTVRFYE
jgi:type III secretory pathway lipoprotein EscJ